MPPEKRTKGHGEQAKGIGEGVKVEEERSQDGLKEYLGEV